MGYQGFTLIECLVSLVILMSVMLFLQPFLTTLIKVEEKIKTSDYLELQIGKIQLEIETSGMEFDKIDNNRLLYQFYDEVEKEVVTVIFEKYQNMIRKTTSRTGHQPIITGIKSVLFTGDDELIRMEVVTLEEERYSYFLFPKK
ncbi:competence type IV pilus minor pilin ComGF [Vagococcus fluvialis]|nr:competence type IV pilus minor pilin ComGF [Vagococcus fluvialis]